MKVLVRALFWAGICVTAAIASDRTRPIEPGLLHKILDRVVELHKEKRSPLVVFDLDDTLVRVGQRTKKIFIDWAAHLPVCYDDLRARFAALDPERLPWDPLGVLDVAGLTDPLLRRSAMRQWHLFFFSNRYLREDRPTAGAVKFLAALKATKARIVYLTGRDKPRMGLGTLDQLELLGFPMPSPTVRLMLKPDAKMKDHVFKDLAMPEIRRMGTVVAGFDNEPKNVNIFKRAFPDAIVIHIDTVFASSPPPLDPGIHQRRDFARPW